MKHAHNNRKTWLLLSLSFFFTCASALKVSATVFCNSWVCCAGLLVTLTKPGAGPHKMAVAVLQLLLLLTAQLSHASKDVNIAEKTHLSLVRKRVRLAGMQGVMMTLPLCACCCSDNRQPLVFRELCGFMLEMQHS